MNAGSILKHGMFLVGYPSFTFRKDIWEKLGGVDETLRIVGDFDFVSRVTECGPVLLHPDIVYARGTHDSNLSGNRIEMYLEDALVRSRFCQNLPTAKTPALSEPWSSIAYGLFTTSVRRVCSSNRF